MENVINEQVYSCLMHPKITGNKGDKCPKCGMELVQRSGEKQNIVVNLTIIPEIPEAGKEANLQFRIKKGNHLVSVETRHEKKVHLLIVNEDLSWFDHVHPTEQADGTYVVNETLPYNGKHLLYLDFKPEDSAGEVQRLEVNIPGGVDAGIKLADSKLVSEVDGYKVTLLNGNDFKANRSQPLTISVEKEGKIVNEDDIQNYLGAPAHIVMIGKKNKNFLHIHSIWDNRFSLYAETFIKEPDTYRIWVQFQTSNVVHTADFTVKVTEAETGNSHGGHHNHAHG